MKTTTRKDIDAAVNRHLDRLETPLYKRIGLQARSVQARAEELLLGDELLSWGCRVELITTIRDAEVSSCGAGMLQAMYAGYAAGHLFKALEIEMEG